MSAFTRAEACAIRTRYVISVGKKSLFLLTQFLVTSHKFQIKNQEVNLASQLAFYY